MYWSLTGLLEHPFDACPDRGIPQLSILWGVEETNYLKFYLFQVV